MPPWTCGADPVDTGVNFSCDTTCEMYYNFKGGSQSPASRVGLNRKRPILSRICAFFRQIVHRGSGEKIGAAAIELRFLCRDDVGAGADMLDTRQDDRGLHCAARGPTATHPGGMK